MIKSECPSIDVEYIDASSASEKPTSSSTDATTIQPPKRRVRFSATTSNRRRRRRHRTLESDAESTDVEEEDELDEEEDEDEEEEDETPSETLRRVPSRRSLGRGVEPTSQSGANERGLRSNSSSAVNYIPMADASIDYGEQFTLARVRSEKEYRCLCGVCHVVLGTKLFLILYAVITMFGLAFGMVSAMVWTGIPIGILVFTVYGFWRKKHKYFYPFLIISVVQLIVCLIMGLVIAVFAILNYDILRMIISHNLDVEPSPTVVVSIVSASVFSCCLLALIHVWQVLVIYSCLLYYEYDLRPDRALISTHGDATNGGMGQSIFESGGTLCGANVLAKQPASHAQSAPIVELGLGSEGVVSEFSQNRSAELL